MSWLASAAQSVATSARAFFSGLSAGARPGPAPSSRGPVPPSGADGIELTSSHGVASVQKALFGGLSPSDSIDDAASAAEMYVDGPSVGLAKLLPDAGIDGRRCPWDSGT